MPLHSSSSSRNISRLCLALAFHFSVGLWLATDAGFASCNDLVVDLAEPDQAWSLGDVRCDAGDVAEQTDRRVVLESGLVNGPDCEVDLVGPDRRATVRVQQNFCGLQAGGITVGPPRGKPLTHCVREGSYAAERAGHVTFGTFPWTGRPLPDRQLRLVSYNVFDRNLNVVTDGQDRRMERLPEALRRTASDLDVLVVQEAFNTDILTYGLCKMGLVHQTPVLTDPTLASVENGGVLLASRWPITRTAQHVFRDACSGNDCFAAKGVVYARVEKGSSRIPFHVFGTHLQADAEHHPIRLEQARQMRRFAGQQGISSKEPVLYVGDFNVDHLSQPDQVREIATALGTSVPSVPEGKATSDPSTNQLVGQDGAAAREGCCPGYTSSRPHRCSCCPREWLDYVFVSQTHRPSASPLCLETFGVRAPAPFDIHVDPFDCSQGESTWRVREMSDHEPVAMTYSYP